MLISGFVCGQNGGVNMFLKAYRVLAVGLVGASRKPPLFTSAHPRKVPPSRSVFGIDTPIPSVGSINASRVGHHRHVPDTRRTVDLPFGLSTANAKANFVRPDIAIHFLNTRFAPAERAG
jgi:hypothetical protein